MAERLRHTLQFAISFQRLMRRLRLVGVVLAVFWASLELSRDRLAGVAYALAFGALLLFLDSRARRREAIFAKVAGDLDRTETPEL
jgi:hypothetical protein